jgi:hypothetical protein
MAKTTMDGTEQILFENTELGEYNGLVFLDKLVQNDTVRIKIYLKDEEDSVYKLRDSKDFSNAQTVPVVGFLPTMGNVGFKITAQQIAGTYKIVTHTWFKR